MLLRRIARPLLAGIFVYGGVAALRDPHGHAKLAEPVLDEVANRAPVEEVPSNVTLVRLDAGVKIGAGVLFGLGKLPRLSAAALGASLVPTTVAGHRFWEIEDPDRRQAEQIQFLKNLGLLGGLMLAAADTEGKPSLAWRARRVGETTGKTAELFHRDVTTGLSGLADRASKTGGQAGERLTELSGQAGERFSGVAGQAGERLSGVAGQAGERLSGVAGQAGERLSEVAGQAGGRFSEVAGQAGDLAATYAGQASDRLGEQGGRLVEGAERWRAEADKRRAEAAKQAGKRARKAGRRGRRQTDKRLAELSKQADRRIADARKRAAKQSKDVRKRAAKQGEQVRAVLPTVTVK